MFENPFGDSIAGSPANPGELCALEDLCNIYVPLQLVAFLLS